ncbi:hypothetical protein N657DRAFT_587335 [Parathielavia appendiculata]|uniref:Uncharacterized protein n=1 Tax=Parathielavia appendiculata TaxID=2587402 RepID=A0AAN6UAZ8_9PEZI|nr:hypothetical protein N657DRAFT_587335 [Parathielavia appendiculata]
MAEPSSDNDATITFKVKSSNDKTHTITMAESATVMDLKTKLAGIDFEDTPPERQRLIYSGRIMKDGDALSVYKIKNMNTIHMVKSARSNPTPASASASTSTSTPAVPQNMAAGSEAGDLLTGLTGARFAGHANLPSADLFGVDGGMGAPPNEDQLAEMLSNPVLAQSMNEALNNPAFIDYMVRANPALASMPNAREMLQSPYFRELMTNPEAIRMAARMRRLMEGGGGAAAFPAPGATDTTPAGAPGTAGSAATATDNNNLDSLRALADSLDADSNALRNQLTPLLGMLRSFPPSAPSAGTGAAGQAAAAPGQAAAPSGTSAGLSGNASQPPNPFAALLGLGAPRAAQGAQANNPFGLPPMSPEAMQQLAQLWGSGAGLGSPAAAAAPVDNRPPEERYAEQLRQLNDMGFFDFERNVTALRRSGGSVQGAVEYLLSNT